MKTLLFSVFALAVLALAVILRLRADRNHHPNAELMIEAVESIDEEEEDDADTRRQQVTFHPHVVHAHPGSEPGR